MTHSRRPSDRASPGRARHASGTQAPGARCLDSCLRRNDRVVAAGRMTESWRRGPIRSEQCGSCLSCTCKSLQQERLMAPLSAACGSDAVACRGCHARPARDMSRPGKRGGPGWETGAALLSSETQCPSGVDDPTTCRSQTAAPAPADCLTVTAAGHRRSRPTRRRCRTGRRPGTCCGHWQTTDPSQSARHRSTGRRCCCPGR
jgi:hypothetical protein